MTKLDNLIRLNQVSRANPQARQKGCCFIRGQRWCWKIRHY